MSEQQSTNGEHTIILTALARIEERLAALPCVERGTLVEKLNGRVKSLESDASFARGAAKATHIIFGLVMVGLVSVGGIVLQIVRMIGGK